MKALILAAGMGRRISDDIGDLPKCLLPIQGEPLLKKSIDKLLSRGINDITIVVGFKQNQIREVFKDYKTLHFVFNDKFETTNGIYSAYLARKTFNGIEDVIVLSGDLFYDDGVLDIAINSHKDPVLLTDSSRIHDADFRFYFKNDILLKYGKELKDEDTTGECLGIAKMSSSFSLIYKKHLEEMIEKGIYNVWWESVLYDLIGKINIYVQDVHNIFWGEVDTYKDYKRILRRVSKKD